MKDPDDILDDHYTRCWEEGLDHRKLHRAILYPQTMPIVPVKEGDGGQPSEHEGASNAGGAVVPPDEEVSK